jgi:hypothetical protein
MDRENERWKRKVMNRKDMDRHVQRDMAGVKDIL